MRFAIINDIHNGPPNSGWIRGVQRKLTYKSEELVKNFVQHMNESVRPRFVVNIGDFIEDVSDKQTDLSYFKETHTLLSKLESPVYHLLGNHDLRTLNHDELQRVLGYEKMNYSFDHDGFHFICLDFQMSGNHTKVLTDIRAEVPNQQLEWLHTDLTKTDKPTILFFHYGLAEDDMKGNFWFESEPHYALLSNRVAVRNILEQSRKVVAVITAHQHWNRMKIHNNIPYITVTSLVENFNNDGIAAEAYSIVDIIPSEITVDVQGNDPAVFKYQLKK